ncbi:MAG: hypothetical protein ABIJ21_07685 [Nanoarchaeota archaeon]
MKTTLDWKLFTITLLAIVLSFYLTVLGKGISYSLALLAIASNIVTAYVSFHHAKPRQKEKAKACSHLHLFVIFLFVLLAIISLFLFSTAYFEDRILSIITIIFYLYLLYLYSYYQRRVWPFRR